MNRVRPVSIHGPFEFLSDFIALAYIFTYK